MPYKHTDKLIPRELKRTVKISEEDKERVKQMHREGVAIREMARRVDFSRRAIQYILFPERLERAKELYKERRKDGRYYSKEKHKIAMRKHRHYKQSIKDKLV